MINFMLLTPQEQVQDCKAHQVVVPARTGMMGVLENHNPTLTTIDKGIVQLLDDKDNVETRIFVDNAFLQVNGEKCLILAQNAEIISGENRDKYEKYIFEYRRD